MNYIFPLVAALLWGGNTLVSKLAAGTISPNEISFLRWLIASALLLPFSFSSIVRYRNMIVENWWRLATLGILGGVIYQSLSYHAATYTSAINMGVIQALVPLLTIILASMMYITSPSKNAIIGATVSLTGVLVVISGGHFRNLLSQGLNRGDVMMAIAVLSMAGYNVLLKRWRLELPLITSMFCQSIAATVVLFPFYVVSEKHALSFPALGMILYAAIGASIVASLSWMAGLRLLGAERVSLFFNLVPIITTSLAVLLLSEPITWALLVGGVLTLAGVIFVEVMGTLERRTRPSMAIELE